MSSCLMFGKCNRGWSDAYSETGLHYNRFRYYDSDVGMFISRDPIELLGGFNVFAYAPNPVGWIDPWGLSGCSNYSNNLGNHGEKIAMKYLSGTGYSRVFSVQNRSGNGLDIVGLRADGKFDIFEVKSSMKGKFSLSPRQATGSGFAQTVLMKDVPNKGGYFMKDLSGNEVPITKSEAKAIYSNIGNTEQINVHVGRNSKGQFANEVIEFLPW